MKRMQSLISAGHRALLVMLATLLVALPALSQNESMVTAEVGDNSRGVKVDKMAEPIPSDSANLITSTTYVFSSAAGVTLEDMSSGTTQLIAPATDDNNSVLSNIGFEFWFDGVRFTQFGANGNGFLSLGIAPTGTSFTNSIATTANAPKIMAFWDDLCTATNGEVRYKTVGSAPNRKLVVEWFNMKITRNGSCTAPVANGTFQIWLHETTGVVQFVYSAIAATTADGGYSVGLQSGVATNFASVTTLDNTVSYAVANNVQMTAIAGGTSYLFTPQVPSAPTGMNFTGVSATGMTVNWSDNASNELFYIVSRSTDGVNFTQVAQLPANSTSYTDMFLSPSTNYTYRVFAVSEGSPSATLSGSQSTVALGSVSSVIGGGNWSSTSTWVGGVVPTASDQVTIVNGATVTIDTDAVAYRVNVGTGGAFAESDLGGTTSVLQFESGTARSLTVGDDVTIATNGALRSSLTGTVTTHSVNIAGDLTNNGVLDLSTNTDTAGAGLTFSGPNGGVFSGAGPTTDVRTITVNKGTSRATTLEMMPVFFTVMGATTDNANAGYLTLTNGTFKISGTFTANLRTFSSAAYVIPATAGIWLNNANYTVTAQTGNATLNGLFRISNGTFNVGTAVENSMAWGIGAEVRVEGGNVNTAGRFGVAVAATTTLTYVQSGGTITTCTVGHSSTTLACFDLGTSTAATVSYNITGGTVVIQTASTAASGPRDYRLQSGPTGTGTTNVTGGTVQFGNAATTGVQAFDGGGVFGAFTIDPTGGAHTFTMIAPVTWNNITRNLTIPVGTTFNIGSNVFLFNGTNIVNNGTLTANGAASNFVPFDPAASVVVSGAGTFSTITTNFGMQAANVTFNQSNQWRIRNFRVFTGSVTNAGKVTLGNNDATVSVVQFGNTTTPTIAGVVDAPFTFDLGTGGQTISYLRTGNMRTMGPEVNGARTLVGLTYDNNDPATDELTVAGGDVTVTGAMALTNGEIITGANKITHNGTVTRTAGFVNGTLNRNYTATGAYTYHVGVNGYSPVLVTVTALTTNPSQLSVKPTDAFLPGLVTATAVSRYWSLSEIGDLTATLAFTYLDADINGTEASYKVFRRAGGVTSEVMGSSINAATNTATVTGITDFSDWGIGEAVAPTMPFASIDGTVTSSGGIALPLTVVVLSNPGGVVGTSLTNGFGNFEFDNIPTNVLYTVTVSKKGYSFMPPSQSFTLTDNITGVNFSGTAARPSSASPKAGKN